MGLNQTPAADRVHIGIFGRRNAGKSSVINAITNQDIAIVSDIKGTTTDPVYKAMELLPIGPVMLIDTPGLDDVGTLGDMRVKKSYDVLKKCDVALLVVDLTEGLRKEDFDLIKRAEKAKIPLIIAYNKSDLEHNEKNFSEKADIPSILISSKSKDGIDKLKEMLSKSVKAESAQRIVGDIISPNDIVLLVVVIDSSAPRGRLILPQQQTIRDILDTGALPVLVRQNELESAIEKFGKKLGLVITDSQIFGKVSAALPKDIPLTSFSILFSRYKGSLEASVSGAAKLDKLKDGDKILISEGCTHHRQCDDIGSVKLPAWIKEYTKKELTFSFSSGVDFPQDLSEYDLIIHCGACMLNDREVKSRVESAAEANIPLTNYGIAIAHMNGILRRSLEPFPHILSRLN